MAFLDPKQDSTFKYVFAEHPDVLIDMLNAILPLKVPIVSLEYLPPELLPRQTQKKTSIVDVQMQRQFEPPFYSGNAGCTSQKPSQTNVV